MKMMIIIIIMFKDSYYTPNANIDFIVNSKIFTHSGMTSLSFPNQIYALHTAI